MDSTSVDLDLLRPLPSHVDVPDGVGVEGLVWLHGSPLGRVDVPRLGRQVYRRGLGRSIVRRFGDGVLRQLVRNGMRAEAFHTFDVPSLLRLSTATSPVESATLTVVIEADLHRPERLDRCLAALAASGVAPAEVIVIGREGSARPEGAGGPDGGLPTMSPPDLEALKSRWSAATSPVRWLVEPSADRGLPRSRALEVTRTPLVAFIAESVRIDARWVEVVCRTFHDHPSAAVVTGSSLPDGIADEVGRQASAAAERMTSHERFAYLSRCLRPDESFPRAWLNPLEFGGAATVAYRTDDLRALGGFDSGIVGQAAAAGQHLDVWLRTLESGRAVVREPAASCRVDGRPAPAEAIARIRESAAGVSASLVAAAGRGASRIPGIVLLSAWFLRTASGDLLRGRGFARSMAWARLCGHLAGMAAAGGGLLSGRIRRSPAVRVAAPTAIADDDPFRTGRTVPIDLAPPADDDPRGSDARELLAKASSVPVANVLATWRGQLLGVVEVVNGFRPATLEQVRRAVIDRHWQTLLVRFLGQAPGEPHEIDGSSLPQRAARAGESAARAVGRFLATGLSTEVDDVPPRVVPVDRDVSIVVPTRDRPDDLRECLRSVLAQKTDRRVEVIVVDNRPESGVTPPVVEEFPAVRLLSERRRGSAYARNRGLLACRGSIIVCVDDDVVVSDGWLERILAPFADPEVAVVTGNVVPLRLETRAERMSEAFTSLSAGGEPFRVDGEWFRESEVAIQAWDFGVSANMAVRSRVFGDPAVGLFAETLGPGTPVGAGEDPYFIYRAIKAGYGLRYSPDAWVWHRHRRTLRELWRQVYNYAKSATGYYLVTGFRHGDTRSRMSLFGGLQRHDGRRLTAALRGRIDVPVWMVLTEIAGHVVGGFSYLASERRRRSLGRDPSHPSTPPSLPDRSTISDQERLEPWAIVPSPQPGHASGKPPAPRGKRGKLPDFLVIGAQKSGTTALHTNLSKHPGLELVPHFSCEKPGWMNTKETCFFSGHGTWFGVPTLHDYRLLFNDNGKLQGEVCPSYASKKAIAQIAEVVPDVKLIFICREPVARMESAINHMMQQREAVPEVRTFAGWDSGLPLDENVRRELAKPDAFGLLRMGLYADTVEEVLRHFPRERLLLLVAEEYRDHPQRTYDTICSFLGVERHALPHRDAHVRDHTTTLSASERRWLAEFYRPHTERFLALLGRDVPAWSMADAAGVSEAEPV